MSLLGIAQLRLTLSFLSTCHFPSVQSIRRPRDGKRFVPAMTYTVGSGLKADTSQMIRTLGKYLTLLPFQLEGETGEEDMRH